MNTDLARRVALRVLADPDSHYQQDYVDGPTHVAYGSAAGVANACPTSACLAGWTIWEAGGPATLRRAVVAGTWDDDALRAYGIPHGTTPAIRLLTAFYTTYSESTALARFAAVFDLDLDALRRETDESSALLGERS